MPQIGRFDDRENFSKLRNNISAYRGVHCLGVSINRDPQREAVYDDCPDRDDSVVGVGRSLSRLIIIPAAVEFDVPSRLSAQASLVTGTLPPRASADGPDCRRAMTEMESRDQRRLVLVRSRRSLTSDRLGKTGCRPPQGTEPGDHSKPQPYDRNSARFEGFST
jgi:hypothetical protein